MNIHKLIALRGHREQSFKFATGKWKGGMKQCKTKGCEIFVPLRYALRGVDVSDEIRYEQMKFREI